MKKYLSISAICLFLTMQNAFSQSGCHITPSLTYICIGHSVFLSADTSFPGSEPVSLSQLPSNLQSGLIGWYPFNGNANDLSTYANHGTVNGSVSLTDDRHGNSSSAYLFTGGYIDLHCPAHLQFAMEQPFSMAGWFLMDGGSSNPRLISSENSEGRYRFSSNGTSNSTRDMYFSYGNMYLSSAAVPALSWHHFVFIYDTSNQNRLFIDGMAVDSNNVHNSEVPTYNNIRFGQKAAPGYDAWGGKIDDFFIYDRAISTSEAYQLYTLSSAVTYSWSTGHNFQTISFFSDSSQYYYCTVTKGASVCTDSIFITVGDPQLQILHSDITCFGYNDGQAIALVSNAPSPCTYAWFSGQTTDTIDSLSAGSYYLMVTDNAGCEVYDSVHISEPAQLSVNLSLPPSDTLLCINYDAILLTGGFPAGGIYGGNGVSDSIFDPAIAGNGIHSISYTYTDTNSCFNTDYNTIYVDICSEINEFAVNNISIYPVPATNKIFIEVSDKTILNEIKLYDIYGRLLFRKSDISSNINEIDISNYVSGIYYIGLESDTNNFIRSIIIK